MNLHTYLLTRNRCYQAGRTITPSGVMVHSTGCNNPYLRRYVQPDDGRLGRNSNGNDWNRAGVNTCVHDFIGKLADGSIATYQTLPWNRRGWHAASGRKGSANNTHISFEICEDGLNNAAYFKAVYQEAVELTAHLCKLYGLNPKKDGVVICHQEGYWCGIASNHVDVLHWFHKFGKTMNDYRADVAREMEDDMTEKQVREIVESVLEEHQLKTYNTVQEVPEWGRDTVSKLVDRGLLQGDGKGLGLRYDLLRTLVLNDRAGVYG